MLNPSKPSEPKKEPKVKSKFKLQVKTKKLFHVLNKKTFEYESKKEGYVYTAVAK